MNINNTLFDEKTSLIVKQTTGLKRDPIDKYYTKDYIAKMCIELVNSKLDIKKNPGLIIEPSAGNGVFFQHVQNILKLPIKMYDIKPEHNNIIFQDYLCLPVEEIVNEMKNHKMESIHVVGNPPFGRQSTLAIKFIKKSCQFADSVSFILPKSFKKDSMQKAFPLDFHLIYQTDLEENSFLVNDRDHNSPCIFQIWKRLTTNRQPPIIYDPDGYSFVKNVKEANASVRRVGVYAGNVSRDTENKSDQSHYFIVFHPELTDLYDISHIVESLNNITYEFNNTVGPKSLSKNELTNMFNKKIRELKKD